MAAIELARLLTRLLTIDAAIEPGCPFFAKIYLKTYPVILSLICAGARKAASLFSGFSEISDRLQKVKILRPSIRFKEKVYVDTLALLAVVPRTLAWSPTVGLVMILSNVLAFALGRATIKIKDAGPAPGAFLGLGLPALLGTTSLGHLIGTGAILGLSNLGVL